jgi:UDP-N-acetylglucosamine--N-acetylmuramyl-(pentapeptide) pyrophosphoryl-undecaprenol N-acetylglucosamine transferase
VEAASARDQSTGRHPLGVVFAGGGTGGHTAAGLALAKALTARLGGDVRLAWVGSQSGIEATWVPAAGIAYHAIPTGKLRRQLAWRNVTDLTLRVPAGFGRAYALLGRLRPAIVVATGGFVAVPTAVAAAARRLPLLVHEQVVVPGLANRFIGRLADRVAVTFTASARAFPRAKVVVTGNPVRPELLAGERARAFAGFGLDPALPLLYITGGALGAHRVNRVVGRHSRRSRRPRSCILVRRRTYGDLGGCAARRRLAPSLDSRYRAVALVGGSSATLCGRSLVVGRAGLAP